MKKNSIVNSSQEQAIASWINYLNDVRLTRLTEVLRSEDANLDKALETINKTLQTIDRDIVNNGHGRGGTCGVHGFIAEAAECGIGNARNHIEGSGDVYKWINDNGPADLQRDATLIQQKFVQSGGHLSLQAIRMHLDHYPDFLESGGRYQIPADHYEKIKWLMSITEDEANKMPTSNSDFSLSQWKEVHRFFASGDVPLETIEPASLDYRSVQKNTYQQTLEEEKESLRHRNEERKNEAYEGSKPSVKEGVEATLVSAFVEGGMSFCLGIVEKKKEGKSISSFDENDWKEITGKSKIGFVKGGIRGASIYTLTNYTATPAAAANAVVTASFGIAEQANLLRKGELDEVTFIDNSESLCVDATISAMSSFAGQALIPVPVLGAVIGNVVGTMMYKIVKDNFSEKEQKIVQGYIESIKNLDADLQQQYKDLIIRMNDAMKLFMGILDKAFSPDVRLAFSGSVELAKYVGVPCDEILDSKEKVVSYFMD